MSPTLKFPYNGGRVEDYGKVGKRLKALRESRGDTQEDVGKLIGTTKYAVYQYERGRSQISLSDLQRLADHYGVTLDYFTGRSPLPEWDEETRRLWEIREGVERVFGQVQRLRPRRIPVVEYPEIHAGWPGLEDAETVEFGELVLPDPAFLLSVRGDSLRDVGIEAGDKVIFEENAEPQNGELVLAEVDNSAVIKFWFKSNAEIELRSGNSSHPPIRTKEARPIGVVRHIIRRAPRWPGQ